MDITISFTYETTRFFHKYTPKTYPKKEKKNQTKVHANKSKTISILHLLQKPSINSANCTTAAEFDVQETSQIVLYNEPIYNHNIKHPFF